MELKSGNDDDDGDDDDDYAMCYMAPEEGSHVRQSIPITFLFDHVAKMSMNVYRGFEEYQVSGG